jgi:hypothetical protein
LGELHRIKSHPEHRSWIAPRGYDSPKDSSGHTADYNYERTGHPNELSPTGPQAFDQESRRWQQQGDDDSDGKAFQLDTRLVANFSGRSNVVMARRIFILLKRHSILTSKSRAN